MHEKNNTMPNIIIWSWMRTVLDLTGINLMLFAYIFYESFDSVHRCRIPLSQMEDWFGVTRQTISRNIDKLCEKEFILKETHKDEINHIIKHNNYRVNMKMITQLCEDSDHNTYKNFLESYSHILKTTFPNDTKDIDSYFDTLLSWHKNKNIKICMTLNDVAKLLQGEESNSISDFETILKLLSERSLKKQEPVFKTLETKQKKLFEDTVKRKSKKTLKNEWQVSKKEMNNEFIFMKCGGNTELLDLLNNFLETSNGRNYTPIQWQQQLDNLYKYGRTQERMIQGVRNSFMNNYRSLYIIDKTEVDIDKKLKYIEDYVKKDCDNNLDLLHWLNSYVTEVPKGKSSTINQFILMIENLSDICKTTEEKINSVKLSYTNSYSALAYRSSKNTQTEDASVDMETKETIIANFITQGYYQLCDGLELYLNEYIHNTQAGKSMTSTAFSIVLDNLRLYCLDDDDKVAKVKYAIQANSNKFATEDFEETRKIKAKFETRESMANSFDRSRKMRVEAEKRKNPNNPKLKDVVLTVRNRNVI